MKESHLGTEQECIEFSEGTDPETEGWWYHSGTESECRALSTGEARVRTKGKHDFWFSRCEVGANHKAEHTHVIRATVNVSEDFRDEWRMEDPENNGLAAGYRWLCVSDPRRFMIERDWIRRNDEIDLEIIRDE